MELFEDFDFNKDWSPPDEPHIPKKNWDNAKVLEIHIPPYTGGKNPSGGPVAKQSTKTSYSHRKDGSLVTFRRNENSKEMPHVFNYTPEPANSASIHHKQFVREFTKFLDVNNAHFTKWVVIEKLVFVYPPLKSHTKEIKTHLGKGNILPKLTIPDLDNLQKLLYDVFGDLNTTPGKNQFKIRYIQNDGMIFWVKNMYKCFGKKPGTYLKMRGQ